MSTDPNRVRITCLENGPYIFEGLRSLKNSKGDQIEVKAKAALCRCGDSSNKPFCDGSHWKKHFDKEAPDPTQ